MNEITVGVIADYLVALITDNPAFINEPFNSELIQKIEFESMMNKTFGKEVKDIKEVSVTTLLFLLLDTYIHYPEFGSLSLEDSDKINVYITLNALQIFVKNMGEKKATND